MAGRGVGLEGGGWGGGRYTGRGRSLTNKGECVGERGGRGVEVRGSTEVGKGGGAREYSVERMVEERGGAGRVWGGGGGKEKKGGLSGAGIGRVLASSKGGGGSRGKLRARHQGQAGTSGVLSVGGESGRVGRGRRGREGRCVSRAMGWAEGEEAEFWGHLFV